MSNALASGECRICLVFVFLFNRTLSIAKRAIV